jgi:hypothetical protein
MSQKTLFRRFTCIQKLNWLFLSRIATTCLCIAFLFFAGFSTNVWLGLIGLPLGFCAAKRLQTKRETHEIIPAQHWMLMSFCLAAFGCGTGLLI